MIYYTADLHFGCQNTFEGRTLDTDDLIIKRWNQKVNNGDTVYILGDVGREGKNEENEYLCRCLSVLKGRKVLIQGNHDKLQDLRIRQRKHIKLCYAIIRLCFGMDSIEETFISMVTYIVQMKKKCFKNSSKM